MAMRTSRALPPPLTSTSTSSRPSDCATCCAISSIFAATIATTSRMVPELPPPTKKWAFAHLIGPTTQTIVYRVYGNCGSVDDGGGDRGVRGHTLGRSSSCSQVTTWVRRRCRTGGWRRCGPCHRGWRHDPEGPPTCVHSHGTRGTRLVIWGNNLIWCFREPRSTLGGPLFERSEPTITAKLFSSL